MLVQLKIMKKKNFVLPQAEIIMLLDEDIIFTSTNTDKYADDDWSQNDGAEHW